MTDTKRSPTVFAAMPSVASSDMDRLPVAEASPIENGFLEMELEEEEEEEAREELVDNVSARRRKYAFITLLVLVAASGWVFAVYSRTRSNDSSYDEHYLDPSAQHTTRSPSNASSAGEEIKCGLRPYKRNLNPPGCDAVRQGDNVNSFWDNPGFLCRLEQRPCDLLANDGPLHLVDRAGEGTLRVELAQADQALQFGPGGEGDVSEVWLAFADRDGKPKKSPDEWKTCFRFWAEGRWFEEFSTFGVNDYMFGSLECCEPQEDDSRFYLIIDGVLVDSCPKWIAESCRTC